MANARAGNVIIVDTDAAFAGPLKICGIRYEAGSGTPSVTIKERNSSGTVIYFADGASDLFEQVYIRADNGIYVDVADTGTKVYLYLK